MVLHGGIGGYQLVERWLVHLLLLAYLRQWLLQLLVLDIVLNRWVHLLVELLHPRNCLLIGGALLAATGLDVGGGYGLARELVGLLALE